MLHPDHDASPFNALPPIVIILVALIGGVEIALQAGAAGLIGGPEAIGWRINLMEKVGFFDRYFEWMREAGTWPFDGLLRFVAYPVVHYNVTHAIFACVMLLAMGKFVGERFPGLNVLILVLGTSALAAVGYGFLLDDPAPLVGAYPAVYGLLGAYSWILFMGLGDKGENRLQAFTLIAVLMGLQLLFQLIGGGGNEWIADLIGFAAGFALSYVLAPDGAARIRRWIDRGRTR